MLNLWPEPWLGARGAHQKDVLENKLYSLICPKKMMLASAQYLYISNWVIAYGKFVKPLPTPISNTVTPGAHCTPAGRQDTARPVSSIRARPRAPLCGFVGVSRLRVLSTP